MTRPTDPSASVTQFWSLVDQRINEAIQTTFRRELGVPRPRPMSVNIPIADTSTTPVVGWLTSVLIFHTSRINAWEINALIPGSISLDVRVSTIPPNPATPPTLTSCPGPSHFPTLNGYATAGRDTSGWQIRDIPAGSVLHVFVNSAASLKQAVFGIQLIDLTGKLLTI